MKLESRKDEQTNAPLSTAALAHVEDRREPENRALEQTRDPLARRDPEIPARDADRTTGDGGPALVRPSASRMGEAGGSENRAERAAERHAGSTVKEEDKNTPLFSDQESKDLYSKWDAVQVGFIDEPRRAVEQADNLVATAMKRTAEVFAEERARLERQWDRGDNVSTEDLRVALRRYRSFFRRLLTI
jgi:hypothetical protein